MLALKVWPIVFAGALVLSGCSKPDEVRTIKSPEADLYLTVETNHGSGAISSDFTRLYAHLGEGDGAARELVLDGDDLAVSKVIWREHGDMIVCLSGGFTNTFHNEVAIGGPENHRTLHVSLAKGC